jgi:hypothetical protein
MQAGRGKILRLSIIIGFNRSVTVGWIAVSLAVFGATVRADRDIVYAAEYYRKSGSFYKDSYGSKPEETLENNGRSHLYRINPDGSGRKQLTFGDLDGADYRPCWSPDGSSVLFARQIEHDGSVVICLIGQNGGPIRRLLETSEDLLRYGDYAWSPDGRRIAIYVPDYYHDDFSVYVIDLHTGKQRKFPRSFGYAWSPDSRRLFLCSARHEAPECHIWSLADDAMTNVQTSVRHPFWLDNQTIIGDMPLDEHADLTSVLRVVTADGHELRRIRLRPAARQYTDEEDDFSFEQRRWHRIPNSKWLLVETCQGISDGNHYACHLIDLHNATRRQLYPGRLVGISPDGTRIAAASAEWVGPYKRGGARVGAVKIISLKTGNRRAITSPLVSVAGGDWRKAKSGQTSGTISAPLKASR